MNATAAEAIEKARVDLKIILEQLDGDIGQYESWLAQAKTARDEVLHRIGELESALRGES